MLSAKNMGISGEQPNIVMFVMDDPNDWVTPLGYDQAKNPNLDRLSKSGVTLKNAHATGVFGLLKSPRNYLETEMQLRYYET